MAKKDEKDLDAATKYGNLAWPMKAEDALDGASKKTPKQRDAILKATEVPRGKKGS